MAGKFDALIVLGAGITLRGNLTRVAKSRMDRAVELYRGGAAPRIIVTGKKESVFMKRYAVKKGVNPANVLLEAKALDTIGNAFFTRKAFLLPNSWQSIVVVTSIFHINRAKLVFRKVLGKSYRMLFVPSKRVLSDKAFKDKLRVEKGLTLLTGFLSALVADGDMEAIGNFVKKNLLYRLYQRGCA